MLTKHGGGDHKRRLSRVHYICTMHCVQCTLEKQCTAYHVIRPHNKYICIIVWPHNKYICMINTLRPRQNCRHFADDIFKCIFLNENVWISIQISLKFVRKGPTLKSFHRLRLGANQATSHYRNQWWLDYQCIYTSLGLKELSFCILNYFKL